jgi:hypothetical protein
MGDRGAAEGDGFEMLTGGIGGFADGFGDLVGLAETDTDLAFTVPDHEERAEAEAATALHDLGASIDENDFFEQIGFVFIATATGPAIAAGSATATASALTSARTTTVISAAFGDGSSGSTWGRRDDSGDFSDFDDRVDDHGFFGKFLFNDRIGLGGHRYDN